MQETVAAFPHLQMAGPGQRLISTLARLFPQMQPSAPPRRGKRLDPRWGEFGLLAALYFTPFNHGRPYPTSLLDAWGRIDEAILYRVGVLKRITRLPPSGLEQRERLEQLRALEHGVRIAVGRCAEPPAPGVDTAVDLERARTRAAATS